ncbi:MAG TPA: hypothetical protein VMN57_03995 [Anaerolineales bacterium]|nr:hypothetical protein [Anaerolineales bacterium]
MRKALFEGLIIDEFDRPVDVAYVGDDPCYVIDDDGFRRHIDAAHVDRKVLETFQDLIQGSEDTISEQAAKMLGQEDIFTMASISQQMKNLDQHFDRLLEMGLPEDQRAFMGMLGFKVRINVHGDVIEVEQPGVSGPEDG